MLGFTRQGTQRKVEQQIRTLFTTQLIQNATYSPAFRDKTDFDNWWQGTYQYSDLRLARNQIEHDKYTFRKSILCVRDDNSGNVVLKWNTEAILKFAEEVLAKASSVCSTLKI